MVFGEAKYPIINPDPTVDDCVKSLRFSDYFNIVGITSGSWAYGYIVGKPARFPTANCAATLGFTFVSLMCLQNTRNRMLGIKENEKEVKKFGMWKKE